MISITVVLAKIRKLPEAFWKTVAIILALCLWQIAASAVGTELLLVPPWKVIVRLFTIWQEKDFLPSVLFTTGRIFSGFFFALFLGTVLGLLAGRFRPIEILLWPYVLTVKSVPITSFIILCLIWLSMRQLTIFIAFLIAFPVIYGNVLSGMKSTDPHLVEMADLYHVPFPRRLLYIYMPNIRPYFLSSASVSCGMAWKAGIAAEVIGVIDGSIGEKLYESKIYFETCDLLTWTVIIILMSVVMEKCILFLFSTLFGRMERL